MKKIIVLILVSLGFFEAADSQAFPNIFVFNPDCVVTCHQNNPYSMWQIIGDSLTATCLEDYTQPNWARHCQDLNNCLAGCFGFQSEVQ